jgi:pilus assembly protein Flp/PilA
MLAWWRMGIIQWRANERRLNAGQGLVEYALILVFVAVVMVIIIAVLGPGIGNVYSNIVAVLQRR